MLDIILNFIQSLELFGLFFLVAEKVNMDARGL